MPTTSDVPQRHAVFVLQRIAQNPIAYQSAPIACKQEAEQRNDELSTDVLAFCTLVARIMMRCLMQQKHIRQE